MIKRTVVRGAVAAAVLAAAATAAQSEIIEQILVKVNGEFISKTELENRQIAAIRQRGEQFDPKSGPTNDDLRKLLDEITPQVLADAVDEMLVVQRGRELGYKLSDDQFKSVIENIRKENKIETDEQFQAALKQENITMAELRDRLERQMIESRVKQAEVYNRIAVPEEDARAYYDAHLGEFTTPAAVTLREILVALSADPKGVNVAVDEAARARADEIRRRALAGEAFEDLAATVSDSPSRANAGLVGPISLDDLSAEFRAALETMKVGDLTDALRTPRGYQILKLESLTPRQTMPFEEARPQIGNRVFTDRQKDELRKYLEKLRSQAIIEWKNLDAKKAYDEGIKRQAAPGS